MNAFELWSIACGNLKNVLSAEVYSRWIDIIVPVDCSPDGSFILSVDNDFCRDWITQHYQSFILDALHVAGADTIEKLVFTIQESTLPAYEHDDGRDQKRVDEKQTKRVRVAHKPQASLASPLNPNFTFENFVTGNSNSFAHGAALGASQEPGRAYNPLFIYGQTGIGKTHLMQAVGHKILERPNMSVCYVSSETLMNEYVDAIKNRTTIEFRQRYRSADVLLVDDIQFLASKEGLQEEFFHTFNALYDARKQIIMTSDLPPSALKGLEPRLVSRFGWGLVTEMECPDFETRLAILKYKISLTRVKLSDEILTFIAENIKSNVRSLEGALTRAVSFATLNNNMPLKLDMLRNLLKDQLSNERKKDLSFDEIQHAVVDFYDIRISDMSSKCRTRTFSNPRQVAMFLCRKLTMSSLPEIANSFEKTHATVVHACKTIQDRIQTEDDLREDVRQIVRTLGRDPSSINV